MSELSFTAVAVPEATRVVMDNPFIDAVRSLIPADLLGENGKVADDATDWQPTGALSFTLENVAQTEQRGSKKVSIFARYNRQLTAAGEKLNVTVRRAPSGTEVPKSGPVTVTFYPVPKIKRNATAAEGAVEGDEGDEGDDE